MLPESLAFEKNVSTKRIEEVIKDMQKPFPASIYISSPLIDEHFCICDLKDSTIDKNQFASQKSVFDTISVIAIMRNRILNSKLKDEKLHDRILELTPYMHEARLISGFTHDLKNRLNAISLLLSNIFYKIRKYEKVSEYIRHKFDLIDNHVSESQRTIQMLSRVSTINKIELKSTDINKLLIDTVDLLSLFFSKHKCKYNLFSG